MKIKLYIIAILIYMILPSVSVAHDGLGLLINGKSLHINSNFNYNEENWGLGLQYDLETSGNWIEFYATSIFIDSTNEVSCYIGYGARKRLFRAKSIGFDIGASALIMSRKDRHNRQPFFAMLPIVSVGIDRVALNITYIPKIGSSKVHVIFLQLNFRI